MAIFAIFWSKFSTQPNIFTTKTLDSREYLTFNALEGVSRYNFCIWMKVDWIQIRFVVHSWQPLLKGVVDKKITPCFNWSSLQAYCHLLNRKPGPDRPKDKLSIDTKIFDQLIMPNQQGPDSVKCYLLLEYKGWKDFSESVVIKRVVLTKQRAAFVDFQFLVEMTSSQNRLFSKKMTIFQLISPNQRLRRTN